MHQAEGLHAGAVDQAAAFRQRIEAGEGGGVLAGIQHLRDLARLGPGFRDQGIGEGGLAHPRLAHQQAGLADQAAAQRIHVVECRQLQHRITQRDEGRQAASRIRQAGRDVGLVQHDQHLQVLALRRAQAARHELVAEAGFGGDHHHHLGGVGGDQLLAPGVRAVEQAAALHQLVDHALAGAGVGHLDPVATGKHALLAAGDAQQDLPCVGANLVLPAEGGDQGAESFQRVLPSSRAMRMAAGGWES